MRLDHWFIGLGLLFFLVGLFLGGDPIGIQYYDTYLVTSLRFVSLNFAGLGLIYGLGYYLVRKFKKRIPPLAGVLHFLVTAIPLSGILWALNKLSVHQSLTRAPSLYERYASSSFFTPDVLQSLLSAAAVVFFIGQTLFLMAILFPPIPKEGNPRP